MATSGFGKGFRTSRCRWLIFDAVGTLIRPNPSVAVAYHSIAAKYGSHVTVEEAGKRFRKVFRASETESFPNGPPPESRWTSSDSIEIARWRWIVQQVVPDVEDIEGCFLELWDHFARPSSWVCFDDDAETLSLLSKKGYRLAIASNFDSRLHAVCDGHSALSTIERRFVSSEAGYRKPAPEFYSLLITHCGCPANEILMIGDDPEHDVAGPVAAGMQAVLLDRKGESRTSDSLYALHQLVALESV